MDGLDLSLAASVLEAKFDSTVVDGTSTVIGGIQDGNRLPSVPELQLSAAGTYRWDPRWIDAGAFVSGSVQHIGDRYTQLSDQTATQGLPAATGLALGALTGLESPRDLVDLNLDAYTTLNLSTGLEFDTWSVTLYANNVTDEEADLSFDRERGGRARLGFHRSQPRTFGVTFRKAF
jgi:outer membrane receptor protein involved in Fe transport